MANTNDVLIAGIGLLATIIGGGLAIRIVHGKNKNQSKIKQSGIGKVTNTATVNQTAKNGKDE